MEQFNEESLLNAENLEWTGKYKEQGSVSKLLIKNFFNTINDIVCHMDFNANDRILETGCGAGLSSLRIKRMLHGQHFEVSDVDDEVLYTFEKVKFPIPYRKESVTQLNREGGEFSCIFLLEVLEHIPEYQQALSEIFRVSNNYIVISTPNEPLWRILNMLRGKYMKNFGNTPGHVNHWSKSSLMQLVSNYGNIVKVYTPIPWIIILAQKRK